MTITCLKIVFVLLLPSLVWYFEDAVKHRINFGQPFDFNILIPVHA